MSRKISELTAAASVTTSDLVPIVDVSEVATKKATIAQLLALADPSVTLGGSNADVMVRASATSTTGVSPGTSGNVLTSNGSAWVSAAPGTTLPEGWTDEGDGRMHARHVEMGDGAALIQFVAATKKIIRDEGSFIDDGFEAGDIVEVEDSPLNSGIYTLANVSALELTVVETLVNEGPLGSINIFLVTQAHLPYGPTNGDFPTGALIGVDASTEQRLIRAKYDGGVYDVLKASGAGVQLGDTFPDDAFVRIYCGSDGGIQLTGAEILLNWTGSYPASDTFIGSSAVLNSNLYLNHRAGSSGGVGSGRGIIALGKRLAVPSTNPVDGGFIWWDDPASGGLKGKLPSGTTGTFALVVGTPASGDILRWNGTEYVPDDDFVELPGGLTAGDLLYWDGAALARVPIGTEGQILTVVSGLPAWADAPEGGGAFDIESLAWTEILEPDYTGSPWGDFASGAAPSVGSSVDGFDPASCNGTTHYLESTSTADTYVAADSYFHVAIVKPSSASSPAGNVYDNEAIIGSHAFANWGVAWSTSGINGYHFETGVGYHETGWKACSSGAWSMIAWWFDGSTMYVSVNAGTPASVAAGDIGDIDSLNLRLGRNGGTAYAAVEILSYRVANVDHSASLADIYAHYQAKYPTASLP